MIGPCAPFTRIGSRFALAGSAFVPSRTDEAYGLSRCSATVSVIVNHVGSSVHGARSWVSVRWWL